MCSHLAEMDSSEAALLDTLMVPPKISEALHEPLSEVLSETLLASPNMNLFNHQQNQQALSKMCKSRESRVEISTLIKQLSDSHNTLNSPILNPSSGIPMNSTSQDSQVNPTSTELKISAEPANTAQVIPKVQYSVEHNDFFNEMMSGDHQVRASYTELDHWLQLQTPERLLTLNDTAARLFLEKGITFTVYSDKDNTTRPIPFDIIPRIIEIQEWRHLERGCSQRIRALNAFLDDVYHQHDIIRAGFIPAEQILANPAFQPWMMGQKLPGKIYAHVSGIDLIRDKQGEYFVLEDNLRIPSGVSYLLEGRRISESLMPEVFAEATIQPVSSYPQLLKQTLLESSETEDPLIVVLTPGRYNSAYYEHAFLAREMGVPLVTGHDLYVDGSEVFLKTVMGPRRVDVMYRRIDDPFLDPLAFNPDSMLGVPGLMAAYRAGSIVIANAPGTGIADDKSIYPYVDKMIEFYLGEKPILHTVPTFQCRNTSELSYVLANLDQLVIKETQGSGGYGMLVGPKASRAELEEFRRKLQQDPAGYIAQPTISLSVCPTCVEEGLASRHIDLRPFILSSPREVRILPGGLTRVALEKGSLVVNSSQGGGVKDTWIITAKEGVGLALDSAPEPISDPLPETPLALPEKNAPSASELSAVHGDTAHKTGELP